MEENPKLKSRLKSKKPKPFDWTDSLRVAVEKRAYGDAKSGALLARIISTIQNNPIEFIYHISQMGFYGEDIWYGYETFCRSDIEMFKACVEIEDKNFYDFILDWKANKALEMIKGKNV